MIVNLDSSMKKIFLILYLLLKCLAAFSQEVNETDKIASLCKIWGFLKYFHPSVAEGDMDWDKVFISEVDTLLHINNKEELNAHYLRWITGLGNTQDYPAQATDYDKSCNYNRSLSWIDSNNLFTPELSTLLKDIVMHRAASSRFVHVYSPGIRKAEFSNENAYSEMFYPAKPYRLLAIARYWNMIEYFFPYKYLMDTSWSTTLTKCIPLFANARDTLGYVNALDKLIANVNDSHATLYFHKGIRKVKYYMPVKVKVFPDKALVTEILNDSLAKAEDIRVGDVLLAINDTSITDWIKYKGEFIGASNEAVIRRNLKVMLTTGDTKSVTIKYDRNGQISLKRVNRYMAEDLKYVETEPPKGLSYKPINDHIGYIDMGLLQTNEIKKAITDFADMKAIIFDLRNYPNLTFYPLGNYLANHKTVFAKCIAPDISFPGKFKCEKPEVYGHKKRAPYKGKIVVLVNEVTQSRAEYTAMVLSALPNSTVIGSQTAGADGDAVNIVLPGDFKLIMSGQGYYYPDGGQTQRVGIKTDIYIEPTIEGMRRHEDEVLNRAIKYIETGS